MSLSFFNRTPTPQASTLSLHDALPISVARGDGKSPRRTVADSGPHRRDQRVGAGLAPRAGDGRATPAAARRSEEHTSELQSHSDLVCRLLLEKKKKEDNTSSLSVCTES